MPSISIRSLTLKTLALLALVVAPIAAAADVSTSVVFTISTPSTIFFGQTVDGSAQVDSSDGSAPTGTITFYDGTNNICTIPVTAGASCPASAGAGFVAGTHILTAVYSGDTDHAGSTSNAISVIVLQDSTMTNVVSSANPAIYGQRVVFTATTEGAHEIPSGAVRFLDGSSVLGTAALNSAGVATLSTSSLAAGTHSITASYGATPNADSSTSGVLSQVVEATEAATTITLTSSANPEASGQNVTFTANVVKTAQPSNEPTGIVTFLDGDIALGTGTLNDAGSATFSTSSLSAGSHTLSASYAGDAASAASTSAGMVQVMTTSQAASSGSFTISAASLTVRVGQTASVMVKVSPANGFNQSVQLGCTNLPSESTCTFGSGMIRSGGGSTMLQLSTMAPHDCGSTTSYYGSLPYAGPLAAGLIMLFLPRKKRRAMKGLLTVLIAFCGLASLMGCGNCTDLGTLPGTYTIDVTGTALGGAPTTVLQKVTLTVTY
jgi:hypothetical protein